MQHFLFIICLIKNGKEASDNDDNTRGYNSDSDRNSEDNSDGPSRLQKDKGQLQKINMCRIGAIGVY